MMLTNASRKYSQDIIEIMATLSQVKSLKHFARMSGYDGYSGCVNGTGSAFCIDCSGMTCQDGLTAVRNAGLIASKLQSGIRQPAWTTG